MDEAVALVLASPVVALALWAVALVGGFSNGEARTAVASELAAQAASQATGLEAADAGGRIALGATLSACNETNSDIDVIGTGQSATVTVECDVSGNRVCFTGYAQTRPAASANARVACPGS